MGVRGLLIGALVCAGCISWVAGQALFVREDTLAQLRDTRSTTANSFGSRSASRSHSAGPTSSSVAPTPGHGARRANQRRATHHQDAANSLQQPQQQQTQQHHQQQYQPQQRHQQQQQPQQQYQPQQQQRDDRSQWVQPQYRPRGRESSNQEEDFLKTSASQYPRQNYQQQFASQLQKTSQYQKPQNQFFQKPNKDGEYEDRGLNGNGNQNHFASSNNHNNFQQSTQSSRNAQFINNQFHSNHNINNQLGNSNNNNFGNNQLRSINNQASIHTTTDNSARGQIPNKANRQSGLNQRSQPNQFRAPEPTQQPFTAFSSQQRQNSSRRPQQQSSFYNKNQINNGNNNEFQRTTTWNPNNLIGSQSNNVPERVPFNAVTSNNNQQQYRQPIQSQRQPFQQSPSYRASNKVAVGATASEPQPQQSQTNTRSTRVPSQPQSTVNIDQTVQSILNWIQGMSRAQERRARQQGGASPSLSRQYLPVPEATERPRPFQPAPGSGSTAPTPPSSTPARQQVSQPSREYLPLPEEPVTEAPRPFETPVPELPTTGPGPAETPAPGGPEPAPGPGPSGPEPGPGPAPGPGPEPGPGPAPGPEPGPGPAPTPGPSGPAPADTPAPFPGPADTPIPDTPAPPAPVTPSPPEYQTEPPPVQTEPPLPPPAQTEPAPTYQPQTEPPQTTPPFQEQQPTYAPESPAPGPTEGPVTQPPVDVFTEPAQTLAPGPGPGPQQPEQPAVTDTPAPGPGPGPQEPGATAPPDDTGLHPPHIHAIDVQCAKDMMTINIEFDKPYDGIIYSKGYFKDANCRYVQPNSGQIKYSFTVMLNSCGTQFVDDFQGSNQAYLENVIVLQNEEGIQEVWDSIRSVRCLWEGNLKQALTVALSVGNLNQEIVTFGGDTGMAKLDIQIGRGPFAPAANGLVKIGEPMTLVVSVEGDPGFDVQVRACAARDADSTNLVQLTDDNGCVLKPKLLGAFQKTKETGNTGASIIAYAFFQAFKFPDVMDLIIECSVDLCKNDCEMCPDPNQKLEPGARRRRRDTWLADLSNSSLALGSEDLDLGVVMGRRLRVFTPDELPVDALLDLREVANETLQEAVLGDAVINMSSSRVADMCLCMPMAGFVLSSAMLLSLLAGSSLLSGVLWLKLQRSLAAKRLALH